MNVEVESVGDESRGRKEDAARAGNMAAAIIECIAALLGAATRPVGLIEAARVEPVGLYTGVYKVERETLTNWRRVAVQIAD